MRCRICSARENRVVRTLLQDNGILRHRRCEKCGHTWKTLEYSEIEIERDQAVIAKARELAALLPKGII